MVEAKFPLIFKECPICHCPDTVANLGVQELKEKGRIPMDAPVSLEKVGTPLEQPELVAMVPILLVHYDVCAACGMRYCTRVDKLMGMAQPIQPPGRGNPGLQFGNRQERRHPLS